MSEERETELYRRRYSKDIHRNMCQALTIAKLTHTTNIARIRGYTMLSAIFKCHDEQHKIGSFYPTLAQGELSEIRHSEGLSCKRMCPFFSLQFQLT